MPKHRKKIQMQPQLSRATKQIELNLIIKGQRYKVPCYVYRYTERAQDIPDFPLGGDPVSIKKIVDGERQESLYLPLYCGFDIETTNVITEDSKAAYMYHWQLVIASNEIGFIYLGRTWDMFVDIYLRICYFYHLATSNRKLLVWDANLGFEFQFLRRRFEWDGSNFFAREERHPLAAPTVDGWDFREALSISGGSLAQLAKDFCITQKLKGDLDYSIMRSSKTQLTEEDLDDIPCFSGYDFGNCGRSPNPTRTFCAQYGTTDRSSLPPNVTDVNRSTARLFHFSKRHTSILFYYFCFYQRKYAQKKKNVQNKKDEPTINRLVY